MPALGHARRRPLLVDDEEKKTRTHESRPANRARSRRPGRPVPTSDWALATTPPGGVRFWSLWIALVLGGFVWQFVAAVLGSPRP